MPAHPWREQTSWLRVLPGLQGSRSAGHASAQTAINYIGVYIGLTLGLHRGYIGIMESKMETTLAWPWKRYSRRDAEGICFLQPLEA